MTSASPYKFLDHFDSGDAKLFFARERETRILVADVVVSRLVVLFAPTGTGKTSLINAGVRPRLEERGYATFFVRVRQDPEQSARAELALAGKPLPLDAALQVALPELSRRIERPIVLFFDQFEEFFLYVDEARRSRFIESIATLHRDPESGVHVVFSMREEFFVEMDAFRERIPTIFHSDSNLRLRPFDRERAREALVGPVEAVGARIDEEVVGRILDDLADRDRIEPAQLQIVADTLWRRKPGPVIGLADYVGLGEQGAGGNIAHGLLRRRLEEQLSAIDSEAVLKLIQRLLPQLVTEQRPGKARTKWVRTVDELTRILNCEQAELEGALRPLESLRFIRTVHSSSQTLVELTHDYLVERIEAFQASVRRVWPRRQLAGAVERFATTGELMTPEILDGVMAVAEDLELGADELRLLFRSAAKAGVQVRAVFEIAPRHGVDLFPIVEELIGNEDVTEASRAAYLLGKVDDPRVEGLAARALEREGLAEEIIDALEFSERPWAVTLIAGCAYRPDLRQAVERALVRLERAHNPAVAKAAAQTRSGLKRAPAVIMAEARASIRQTAIGTEPPYENILSALGSGVVVPFLGAGASMGGDEESSPPGAEQLAALLSETLSMPLEKADATSVQRLASYLIAMGDRAHLNALLDRAFRRTYAPRPIHRFLATLPAPLVIVTTNYDDLMEKAFEELDRPFDTIVAPGGDKSSGGGGWLWRQSGFERRERASRLRFQLEARPVVIKLKGSVGRDGSISHYVITEEDQLDQLFQLGGEKLLPDALAKAVGSRSFLFLGHSLRDWSVRLMLRMLGAEKQRRSWAILRGASEVDVMLWGNRAVRVFDLDVNDFAEQLKSRSKLVPWATSVGPGGGGSTALADAGEAAVAERFVFLSAAKSDFEAALGFGEALKAREVNVFLDALGGKDEPELRKIIGRCDLFIVLVSKGYLARRDRQAIEELRVALDRYQMMKRDVPFILPVIIDDVSATVLPDGLTRFRAVRAPGGELSSGVAETIFKLLAAHNRAPTPVA